MDISRNRLLPSYSFATVMFTLIAVAQTVIAHHSHTAFDPDNLIEINGVVEEIDYRNPHIEIVLRVGEDDPSTSEVEGDLWVIDTVSATGANRHKLYRDTIQAGHPMRILGWPAKNGDLAMYAGTLFIFEDPEAALAANQRFEATDIASDTESETETGTQTQESATTQTATPVTVITTDTPEASVANADFPTRQFIFRESLW